MPIGDGQPQPFLRGRRRRLWLLGPLLLVLLIIFVAGAAWNWRLPLAERVLAGVARSAGLELHTVSIDRLDFSGAELSDLRLGPEGVQELVRARVTWSLAELLDRRVRTLIISGASVQVTVQPNGRLVLDGVSLPDNTEPPVSALAFPNDLPFTRIDVEKSRIAVMLPDGTANLAIEGSLAVSPEVLTGEISTRYSATTERGSGSGRGGASLSWRQNSAPSGEFDLQFDRLVTASATATNVRITGATDRVPAHLQDLTFSAEASATQIDAPPFAARNVAVNAELSGGALNMRAAGEIDDQIVEFKTALQPFDLTRPATFDLHIAGDAAEISERVGGVSAEGDIAIDLSGEVADPVMLFSAREVISQSPWAIADHVVGRLEIETKPQRFALADLFDTGAAEAKFLAHWSNGVLDVDIGEPSHIGNVRLESNLEKTFAPWLRARSPFDIAMIAGMGSQPTMRISRSNGRFDVRGIGGIDVTLPEGTIILEIDGSATATMNRGVEKFDIAALSAKLPAVPTEFGRVSGDVLATEFSSEGGNIAGTIAAELAVAGASIRALSARQIKMSVDGLLSSSEDEMSVTLSSGSSISGRDVKLADGFSLAGSTRLQLAAGNHRVSLNRRSNAVSVDARLKPSEINLQLVPRAVDIGYDTLSVSGLWPGGLTMDANNISAGLDAERRITLEKLHLRAVGDYSNSVVTITAGGAQPSLPGLTPPPFDANGRVVRRGPSLDGEFEIVAVSGQPSVRARVQHNIESGDGKAEIIDARLRFAPGVLQPGDINPAVSETIENVFATISVQGSAEWDGGGALVSNLEVSIGDLAASTENIELFDAQATVKVTGAAALQTPPGQKFTGKVRIGRLDPVPVDVSFQLSPGPSGAGPQLIVERLAAQLAEGSLTTDQFILAPPGLDTDVTIRLERADLARAFAVIGIAGIGGTGRISGEIPISVRGNQVAISGGRLANEGPGEVFYDIAVLPQQLIDRDDTVTLVLRALSNFAYDELQVEMDKALEGPGSVRVRLTGANPDVLENHPFVFNISLESNFDRLAALVLEGLTTSQGLLRALALSARDGGGAGALP